MNTPKPPDKYRISDAPAQTWTRHFQHTRLGSYLQLMRADRPIGVYLLFWPAVWGTMAAEIGTDEFNISHVIYHCLLFLIGAYVMRGAGCTWNDILDRNLDKQVERTRNRPLASERISVSRALIFMVGLLLVGALILWQFNPMTRLIGILSIPLVVLYPLMKRITHYPQFVLGLAFNWGALVGWTATHNSLSLPMFLLYAAGLFWTLSYDTIYAHQDKSDDAIIGIKSTALKLGDKTKSFIIIVNSLTLIFCALTLIITEASPVSYGILSLVGLHFAYQSYMLDINNPSQCLKLFRENHYTGALIALCLLTGSIAF